MTHLSLYLSESFPSLCDVARDMGTILVEMMDLTTYGAAAMNLRNATDFDVLQVWYLAR